MLSIATFCVIVAVIERFHSILVQVFYAKFLPISILNCTRQYGLICFELNLQASISVVAISRFLCLSWFVVSCTIECVSWLAFQRIFWAFSLCVRLLF